MECKEFIKARFSISPHFNTFKDWPWDVIPIKGDFIKYEEKVYKVEERAIDYTTGVVTFIVFKPDY